MNSSTTRTNNVNKPTIYNYNNNNNNVNATKTNVNRSKACGVI